mmetsp:Transcript_27259/g.44414  ORF Transcript_27259/g.44414 Transcript_27259/m.44414 type:complete len:334 (-) Transcript_27259:96-1097(-)
MMAAILKDDTSIRKLPVVYTEKHEIYNPGEEFFRGVMTKHYEHPDRVSNIYKKLSSSEGNEFLAEIVGPTNHDRSHILAVHSAPYFEYVSKAFEAWSNQGHPRTMGLFPHVSPNMHFDFGKGVRGPTGIIQQAGIFCFDTFTPIREHSYAAALDAVDVALTAADLLLKGDKTVYALCRPPGHHAGSDYCGGYCFFNNAAIAAIYLRDIDRCCNLIAILDIDFHHGNGTQQIFYDSSTVLYVSIHGDPDTEYPYYSGRRDEIGKGQGTGYNLNFPLPNGTGPETYLKVLDDACDEIVKFGPKYLIVSAGFDTYEKDPIGGFKLTLESYKVSRHV